MTDRSDTQLGEIDSIYCTLTASAPYKSYAKSKDEESPNGDHHS